MNNLFIFLFCIIFLIFIVFFTKNYENFTFDKIPLWTFYDEKNSKIYLDICLETIKKYTADDFDLILLDSNSIKRYLPDFNFESLNNLMEDDKINYIKFKILENYGGLWIDINTIVFDNLKVFTDKLIQYDFIGFGCINNYCDNNYYSKPIINIMGARKNSLLLKIILDLFDEKINSNTNIENIYNDIFWPSIKEYCKDNEYYHFKPIYSSIYDEDKTIIRSDKIFSKNFLKIDDIENLKVYNINFSEDEDDSFYSFNKNHILSSNKCISFLLRKSLFPDHPFPSFPVIYNENIDVYVLYIDKREQYIKNIINTLFLNPIFYKGFNKYDLNEDELIKDNFVSKEWTLDPKFNFGRVACHMGHLSILKNFLASKKKYALIFEDDISIDITKINLIREKIFKILNNIPEDAEIVYLSYCWEYCTETISYNEMFVKSIKPLCRHMYLVSKPGARIILNNTTPLFKPGDNTIADLISVNKLKSYNVKPEFLTIEQDRKNLGSNLDNDKTYKVCSTPKAYKPFKLKKK